MICLRPADHAVNDPARTPAVSLIADRIRHGEKCLYRVHIGIESAVVVQLGKRCIPRITRQALGFVPEFCIV